MLKLQKKWTMFCKYCHSQDGMAMLLSSKDIWFPDNNLYISQWISMESTTRFHAKKGRFGIDFGCYGPNCLVIGAKTILCINCLFLNQFQWGLLQSLKFLGFCNTLNLTMYLDCGPRFKLVHIEVKSQK